MKKHTDEEILAAVEQFDSQSKAAKALGLNKRTLERRLARIKLKSVREVPQMLAGRSTLHRGIAENGEVVQEWVKTSVDRDQFLSAAMAAIDELKKHIPRSGAVSQLPKSNGDLLNVYTITDLHLGMLAWAEETGGDWDMSIAESLLLKWFESAIASSPPAQQCVFAQLGDMCHFDSLEAVTPTSRNLLDSDTRYTFLVRSVIRIMSQITDMLTHKYGKVYIVHAEGNHDLASSVWMRELFAAKYEGSEQVTIETRPDPYYCYEFGDVSLFWHHGHKKRMDSLDTVFVAKFRDVFGRTKHSYAHTGHLHHKVVKETNLMIIEQHRTLAAPDAHASRGGWMSGRSADVITYHRKHGEVSRLTISPEMLK